MGATLPLLGLLEGLVLSYFYPGGTSSFPRELARGTTIAVPQIDGHLCEPMGK